MGTAATREVQQLVEQHFEAVRESRAKHDQSSRVLLKTEDGSDDILIGSASTRLFHHNLRRVPKGISVISSLTDVDRMPYIAAKDRTTITIGLGTSAIFFRGKIEVW